MHSFRFGEICRLIFLFLLGAASQYRCIFTGEYIVYGGWSKSMCVNCRHAYWRHPDVMQHCFYNKQTNKQHGLSQGEIHDYDGKFPEALLHDANN